MATVNSEDVLQTVQRMHTDVGLTVEMSSLQVGLACLDWLHARGSLPDASGNYGVRHFPDGHVHVFISKEVPNASSR